MLDAASSNHCFFVSPLDDMTIISLPPLDTPLEPLRRCAISSSPLSPDCTIVFSTFMDTYLAYTRPGEDDDDDELLLMGDIVSCQGKMYVPTDMSSIAMLDVSSYPPHIERRGIPEPSCIHSMANAMLVESPAAPLRLRRPRLGAPRHAATTCGARWTPSATGPSLSLTTASSCPTPPRQGYAPTASTSSTNDAAMVFASTLSAWMIGLPPSPCCPISPPTIQSTGSFLHQLAPSSTTQLNIIQAPLYIQAAKSIMKMAMVSLSSTSPPNKHHHAGVVFLLTW